MDKIFPGFPVIPAVQAVYRITVNGNFTKRSLGMARAEDYLVINTQGMPADCTRKASEPAMRMRKQGITFIQSPDC